MSLNTIQPDVFISYAHRDNQVADENEWAWVTYFQKRLEIKLSEYLAREAHVWRDETDLRRDVNFHGSISEKCRTSKLLAVIMSPSYLESKWCQDELEWFHHSLPSGNARIYKIGKIEVGVTKQPGPLNDLVGYTFFEKAIQRQNFIEFNPNSIKYKEILDDKITFIAQDLTNPLKKKHGRALFSAQCSA